MRIQLNLIQKLNLRHCLHYTRVQSRQEKGWKVHKTRQAVLALRIIEY